MVSQSCRRCHVEAMFNLALLMLRSVFHSDDGWMERAAKSGHADAAEYLRSKQLQEALQLQRLPLRLQRYLERVRSLCSRHLKAVRLVVDLRVVRTTGSIISQNST